MVYRVLISTQWLCRTLAGPLSRCRTRQASDGTQRLIHCTRVRKDFCDIRVEKNDVSTFRVPCGSDAADRFRKIVLGTHSIFVRPKRPCFAFTLLHIAFVHVELPAEH